MLEVFTSLRISVLFNVSQIPPDGGGWAQPAPFWPNSAPAPYPPPGGIQLAPPNQPKVLGGKVAGRRPKFPLRMDSVMHKTMKTNCMWYIWKVFGVRVQYTWGFQSASPAPMRIPPGGGVSSQPLQPAQIFQPPAHPPGILKEKTASYPEWPCTTSYPEVVHGGVGQ